MISENIREFKTSVKGKFFRAVFLKTDGSLREMTCRFGVKKRCRKSERHFLRMGYIPYNGGDFDRAELENTARNFIQENMKNVVGKPEVTLDFVEREKDNYGTIEKWQPFSEKNKRFVLQSSLENELQ